MEQISGGRGEKAEAKASNGLALPLVFLISGVSRSTSPASYSSLSVLVSAGVSVLSLGSRFSGFGLGRASTIRYHIATRINK